MNKQYFLRPFDMSRRILYATHILLLAMTTFLLFGCTANRDQTVRESWDYNGLRLTLSTPKFQYEVGDEVTVTASVENITDQIILWQSAKTDNPEYVFDVEVEGIVLSSVHSQLQVYSRELKPQEKVEVTYTFKPQEQKAHPIFFEAYIYSPDGTGQMYQSIGVDYGYWKY